MEWSVVVHVILLFCSSSAPASRAQLQGTDLTKVNSARGADVVEAVIALSRVFNAFTEDQEQPVHYFIRHMAYVESRDGQDTAGQPGGGIWRITPAIFEQTRQFIMANMDHDNAIYENFDTRWQTLDYMDLETPLYSGLAARIRLLQLYGANNFLTATENDLARAHYWLRHYKNGAGNTNVWTNNVNTLRSIQSKSPR